MALGLSFGSNKESTSQNSAFDRTGIQNQTGTTGTNQTQTGSTSSTGTRSGSSSTSSAGTGASSTQQNTTGSQQQVGRTSLFSDNILAALEAAGLGGLNAQSGPIDTSALNGFNPTQFVDDATSRAQAAADRSIGIGTGGLFDSIGGTAGGNTMAALLAQQMNAEGAASVSGARADATGAAQQILRENIGTNIAARGQELGFVDSILSQLKGGAQTTDVTGTTTEASDTQQRNTQQQVGSEQNQQVTTQQQDTVQNLVSLVEQLISGTNRESGSESMTGTTSKSGGGFSLGL